MTLAYARIYMYKIKIDYSNYLYQSDTDSAVLTKPLPDHMVGDKLGQFKLEYKIKKGVFLCPKVQGLILEDGKEINATTKKVKKL